MLTLDLSSDTALIYFKILFGLINPVDAPGVFRSIGLGYYPVSGLGDTSTLPNIPPYGFRY